MTSQFGPLGEPGDVVTADMVHNRLGEIADMAIPGASLRPIVDELEYLVEQLSLSGLVR